MNPKTNAMRAGLSRGVIELRQTFQSAQDLWGYLFPAVILIVVLIFMRDANVPGTTFSLGAQTLPSVLGMNIAFVGLASMAALLAIEREDGTLLRAKATPNGMLAYLIGKIVVVSGMSIVSLLLILVPGAFIVDGLALDSVGAWLTLAWVIVLGLVATLPIGAVLGSIMNSPRNMGFIMIPLMALIAGSGIFYPINSFPGWLQGIAQVFPVYWLGLGMRSALLPGELAAVELGGSWRHLETLGVLGVWAVLGLVVAPVLLRRMARRESGSQVVARREAAMQRVGP
jgi:ABC-2 type transport system permease protein